MIHKLILGAKGVSRGMGTKCISRKPVILSTLISSPAFKRPMQQLPICAQTQLVHQELERRHVLPQTHLVDAGYVDAGALVESRELYGVELVGPVSRNNQWQAKAGKGYDQSGFALDFEAH